MWYHFHLKPRTKIISNKTIKMEISSTHCHFKFSNRKLVLPFLLNMGESSQVNRPRKYLSFFFFKYSFLIWNVENNLIWYISILKFSIKPVKSSLFHFLPFVRIVADESSE